MTTNIRESWQHHYFRHFYHSLPHWEGGTTEFWNMLHSCCPPDSAPRVLELGCGPGNPTTEFLKNTYKQLDGLDVDPDAAENPWLDEFFLYDGLEWPFPDNSYDLIVADYVLEHVETPIRLFHEIQRVLREGGVFLFRTPNLWHYVSLISALTPHWFHTLVAKQVRQLGDEIHEPYPTHYRVNTEEMVCRIAKGVGLEQMDLRMVEKEPMYGQFSRLAFLCFVGYERLVNHHNSLRHFRSNIFAAFRKPAKRALPAPR